MKPSTGPDSEPAGTMFASTEPLDLAGRVERTPKRVRAHVGGRQLVDTTDALLVWEQRFYPAFYFPERDVNRRLLVGTGALTERPPLGRAEVLDLVMEDERTEAAAWRHEPNTAGTGTLGAGDEPLIRIDWPTADAWFEENEQIIVHPRSPYVRVDVQPSSRRVEVHLGATPVASSANAVLLTETGLRARWYLPKTDVRMELLTPSDTTTQCPYKGTARYWSASVDGVTFPDLVWSYDEPLPESHGIGGLVCFYEERFPDQLTIMLG